MIIQKNWNEKKQVGKGTFHSVKDLPNDFSGWESLIEEEIKRVKGTIGWLWGKGDINQRKYCVKRVEEETKLKIDNKDLPKDLQKEETKLLGQRGDKKK